MAKTRPNRSAKLVKPNQSTAEANAERLRALHAEGVRLLEALPVRAGFRQSELKDHAAELGVSPSEIVSMRQFARLYGKKDLERLCRRRTEDGRPITWNHVRVLLRVEDQAMREELEKLTAEEGWSNKELRAEVRLRQGRGRTGSRPIAKPRSVDVGLLDFLLRCQNLTKFLDVLTDGEGAVLAVAKPPKKKADRQRRAELLEAAAEAAEGLRGRLKDAVKRLQGHRGDLEAARA